MTVGDRSSLSSLLSHEVKGSLLDTPKKRIITYIILFQLFITSLLDIIQIIGYNSSTTGFKFDLDAIICKNLHQLHFYFLFNFIVYFLCCFETIALMMYFITDPIKRDLIGNISLYGWKTLIINGVELLFRAITGSLIVAFYFVLRSNLTWNVYRKMGANFYTFKLMKKRQLLWALLKLTFGYLIMALAYYVYLRLAWNNTDIKIPPLFSDIKVNIATIFLCFIAFLLIGVISLKKEIRISMFLFIILFSGAVGYLSLIIYYEIQFIIQLNILYKNSAIFINSILNLFLVQGVCVLLMLMSVIYSIICLNQFGLGLQKINFYNQSYATSIVSTHTNENSESNEDTATQSSSLLESTTDLNVFLKRPNDNEKR
ncbi:hypothetical protein K502DRAFT_363615 [Neoconidiobolus thromboides FSU 785]|nr:hypothetical protein K502DRAFT_363615 [Neoconidiobolus thromboides FSU 785]